MMSYLYWQMGFFIYQTVAKTLNYLDINKPILYNKENVSLVRSIYGKGQECID